MNNSLDENEKQLVILKRELANLKYSEAICKARIASLEAQLEILLDDIAVTKILDKVEKRFKQNKQE